MSSSAILQGMGFGFALALMLGPVFFGLLQTSINKGFKFGFFFALGVAFSDIVFILLTYFGISSFMENLAFKKFIAIVGGIFMVGLGLYYFVKPSEKSVPLAPIQKERKKANIVFKGFLLNFLNPSVFFFWVGMVSIVTVRYEDNRGDVFWFFTASVLTVLFMDVTKAYVANKIKRFFTTNVLNKMNKALGIALIAAGAALLYDGIANKGLL